MMATESNRLHDLSTVTSGDHLVDGDEEAGAFRIGLCSGAES